jgi:glutathione-regulated potassium-efflux system ancillary protein KefF
MIVVIYAHPYPGHSRACAALVEAIAAIENLEVRSLYSLYPDFDVDPAEERSRLEGAKLVVWLHPLYWYSVPALMKQWLDQVLVRGWAYGEGGTALAGKDCLWVTTTGGDAGAYTAEGRHGREFADFVPALERTAKYCSMRWLEPFVVHGAHLVSDEELKAAAEALRGRIEAWKADNRERAA